jgi:crotonobetainyl-CoA:carnitine CoA-transferase CaiB-like acyl-CoA transferase
MTVQDRQGPLTDIRVVEFTTAWAGPLVGRVLAFLGAEVVHVEAATRLDGWRHYKEVFRPERYPDGQDSPRRFNRISLFNSQNINKLALSLDIKKPGGREAFLRLAAASDVVVCNFTAGTLDRSGIGYEDLRRVKPDIIVVELPAYGRFGPMAKYTALGPTMEMAAGMCSMIGYPESGPTHTGPAYMDPIGGFHGAAAVLTALRHRDATGEGQYVEVPQAEAAMHFIGEEILSAMDGNPVPSRRGNRVDWAAPHDAFPTAGDDEWMAIAVTSDAEWVALCQVMADAELGADERFATVDGRKRHEDLLFALIARWTRTQPKHAAAAQLQAAGVPAAPVHTAKDNVESVYLRHRGFFTPLPHPEAGLHEYPGLPFHLERTPGAQRHPAPCFGQHSWQVLRDIAGLTNAEIDRLEEAGAISGQPA